MPQASSGELAYDKLLQAIRSGAFRPGDRLREEEVSESLSMSRTPVREAIRRLEADGIVEHRPRHGAVIRQLYHGEVVELYEMRTVLERTAAQLAAKHGTAAEFDALEDLNGRISAERATPAAAAAINQDFHRGVYLACRNRFLVEAARTLNNSLMLLGSTTFTDPERIDVVVSEHAALVDALRAGDANAAATAAETHLNTSLRVRLGAMKR
ncbi:MAG: GntR family transcriptional regulator [Pseudomonadota bacterium]